MSTTDPINDKQKAQNLEQSLSDSAFAVEEPLCDKEALYILESLELDSFENALNAFADFLSGIDLFGGASRFSSAATALDAASLEFAAIDADHNFLLTKEELDNFLVTNPSEANPLSWLVANFNLLEQMSFFGGGITRAEIEAARDVFHGLNHLQTNFDAISKTHMEGKKKVSKKEIAQYLDKNKGRLDKHDARGLAELEKYLDRLGLN